MRPLVLDNLTVTQAQGQGNRWELSQEDTEKVVLDSGQKCKTNFFPRDLEDQGYKTIKVELPVYFESPNFPQSSALVK